MGLFWVIVRKLEHLFLPELRLGFMSKSDHLDPQIEPYKIIRARRFTDAGALKKSRKRIAFNKKAWSHLRNRAGGYCRSHCAAYPMVDRWDSPARSTCGSDEW